MSCHGDRLWVCGLLCLTVLPALCFLACGLRGVPEETFSSWEETKVSI